MRTNIRVAVQNALTGFAPSVFLFMAITVPIDGIRFFMRNRNWEEFFIGSIQNQDFWKMFALELLLLTSGYVITTSLCSAKYLSFAWRRSVVAGLGAVILLGLLSIFAQGARLPVIALASLGVGMISVLFLWHRTPQTTGN